MTYTVSFRRSESTTDWIGLYEPGASDNAYTDWVYTSGSKAPGSTVTTRGSVTFGPSVPGLSARMFAADGYTQIDGGITSVEQPSGGRPNVYESDVNLVSKLYVQDLAPYEVACEVVVPRIDKGQVVFCYAEYHADPRQTGGKECAIVSGIWVPGVGFVARQSGEDSYYAEKTRTPRVGTFTAPQLMLNVPIQLQMRALNKYKGGYCNVSWAKVGCLVF